MNKKVLCISDTKGIFFINKSKPIWEKHGFVVEVKDYDQAVRENDYTTYSIITFTMNHSNSQLYHEYGKSIRKLTKAPIVFFPYGIKFPVEDKIKLLDDNANEVVSLPTNIELAIANCIALTKQHSLSLDWLDAIIVEEKIILDMNRYIANVDGKDIELTKTECHLLYFLMKHRNQIMTYRQIFRNVWGEEYIDSSNNVIWNQIRNIRNKIQWNPNLPHFIISKHGIGYCFCPNKRQ